MKRSLYIILILLLLIIKCVAQPDLTLLSPDKQTACTVFMLQGKIYYTIKYAKQVVLERSALGLELNDQALTTVTRLKLIKSYSINEHYASLGVHAISKNYCNGYRVDVYGNDQIQFGLDVRVYNDGVAFRYLIHAKGKNAVTKDLTSFHVPGDNSIWYQTNIKYYEGEFRYKKIDSLNTDEIMGPPATIQYKSGLFAAITEGGLTDFAGMRLEPDSDHTLNANLSGKPVVNGNFKSPWRIIMIGKNLNELVNNDIVSNVSAAPDKNFFPEGVHTNWIKPGRSVWSWLAGNGPVTLENMMRFSKWAGELGFEYNLVDDGWSKWKDSVNHRDAWAMMKELVEYSASQKVKVWVWKAYPDRDGVPGIRDSTQRDIFFKRCHDLGIAGLKIDFFDSEQQEIIQFYQSALRDAARYHLMIDFHGSNKPTGESRTWPNELTREGIMGLEYDGLHSNQNTIIPFTRYLAGHADYTPLQIGKLKGERSLSHHLATVVTFTSPLLCLAVNPEELISSPYRNFVASIPTTWDETIVLPQSSIGSVSIFARRKGKNWHLAVINNDQPRKLMVDLSFLPEGNYHSTIIKDDPAGGLEAITEKIILKNKSMLQLELAASGGFVAMMEK